MSKPIIQVNHLSKRYRLGEAQSLHQTLPELVGNKLRSLWRSNASSQTDAPLDASLQSAQTTDHWALRDVSFELPRGQVLGIIGCNGAGKSTLLKILSRITEPSSGQAILRGRVASLLEVGTGFHPELTGRENIFLNGTLLGLRRHEVRAKFDQIVDFSGVEKFIDTPVKHYSSGMTVRLAFAVAAHLEPEILIADEVLAVGDVAFQRKCLGKMQEVANTQGRTVLFVSHNMAAIQQLCQRAIVLNQGEVLHDGLPADGVRKYLDLFMRSSAEQGDISKRQRAAQYGTLIRFHRWSLLDATAQPTTRLKFGEPVTMELLLRSHAAIENAVLEIGLQTADATPLTTFTTEHRQQPLTIEKDQDVRVKITVDDLRLMPGTYTIWLTVRSTLSPLDHVPAAGMIEVTQELFDSRVVPSRHRTLIHNQPTWEMTLSQTAQPALAEVLPLLASLPADRSQAA